MFDYDFFSDFFGDDFKIYVQSPKVTSETVCKSCGMGINEFLRTGKLGCSNCYEAFNPQIKQLLKRIHGNTSHVGKIPKGASSKLKVKRKMEVLRQELAEAIVEENFEKAAEIRDKLKQIGEGGEVK